MFEKIIGNAKKEPKEPEMNRAELLKEIRVNNCREILAKGITLRVLEHDKIIFPEKHGQIEQVIQQQKQMKNDLIKGVEIIDDELAKINKK